MSYLYYATGWPGLRLLPSNTASHVMEKSTQELIYHVRALKGISTMQLKNSVNRCQEIAESLVYDPDDMNVIKE